MRWLAELPLRVREDAGLFTHAIATTLAVGLCDGSLRGHVRSLQAARNAQARVNVCGHMHEPMLYHLSAWARPRLPAASRRVSPALPPAMADHSGGSRATATGHYYAIWHPGDGVIEDG